MPLKNNKILSVSMVCAGFLIIGLGVSGCGHYTQKMESQTAAMASSSGGNFSDFLAQEYEALAQYEQEQRYDYRAAKYYTDKVARLRQGALVPPAYPARFNIKSAHIALLREGRAELIAALQTYNIAENRKTLAVAQSRFDCWVDQVEERKFSVQHQRNCEQEFKAAMAVLVEPSMAVYSFKFDEEGAMLNEAGRIALNQLIERVQNHPAQDYQVILSPSALIPAAEQARRVSMIQSILQFNGIPAQNILRQDKQDLNADSFDLILRGF